jgi:hypothetical protein
MKERKSELLRFGQEVADQALTKLAASGSPSDGLDMASVMQLLQPIVDKMLQDNPEALGEPITPEHMAYISAEGLRYEQIEQVCQQVAALGTGICMLQSALGCFLEALSLMFCNVCTNFTQWHSTAQRTYPKTMFTFDVGTAMLCHGSQPCAAVKSKTVLHCNVLFSRRCSCSAKG